MLMLTDYSGRSRFLYMPILKKYIGMILIVFNIKVIITELFLNFCKPIF